MDEMRFMVDNFTGKDVEKLMKAAEQDMLAILDAGEIHWIGFEIRTGFISNRLRTANPLMVNFPANWQNDCDPQLNLAE